MNFDVDTGTAIIVIAAIVLVRMVDELVKIFFQRMRASDYVTKTECERCSKVGIAADASLEKQVKVIKNLLFVVAMKVGVESADIQKLINSDEEKQP